MSFDNLAPSTPDNFRWSVPEIGRVELKWDSVPENDFDYYLIYRSLDDDFTHDENSLIGTTTDTVYTDINLDNINYNYKISAIDFNGNESDPSESMVIDPSTLNNDIFEGPDKFALHRCYPNPFNPKTNISFQVPEHSRVIIDIYDSKGQLVNRLFDGYKPMGTYNLSWDAKNLSSGTYFVKMISEDFIDTQKLMLIK